MLLLDANAAANKYNKRQEYQDLYHFSVAVALRDLQREVDIDRLLESRLHIDYWTNKHNSQLRSTDYPDCCFMAILSQRKPLGPRIMRKLWSNTRERTQSKEKELVEDSSYPKCIEDMPRETARNSYPENVDNPMTAPRYNEVRQSGRVLELQNKDLCIRPTVLSWLFPILVTICELLFKKYRGRSSANVEARDEAEKQKDSEKQKSNTVIRHGSRISIGNEVLYIDPFNKDIHGDENKVCF